MNQFNRRAATRIATVSVVLALVASSLSWFVARENAEEGVVSMAMEESRRLLAHFKIGTPEGDKNNATKAAEVAVGGLFDIAEIYDANGSKLAEAMTRQGQDIEDHLPSHGRPNYVLASYESLNSGENWVMRVFVPLSSPGGQIIGYFEGVRIVPEWQRKEIYWQALVAALLAGFASLLCGGVIYPVVVYLSADNKRKAREVLDSQLSMMEALGRAIGKRDSDTGGHNFRVAWIAARIGEAMGLRGYDMQALIVGSFLHDIGKIGIPDAILLKPGKLDAQEMNIMRTHVAQGEEIVGGIGWLDGACGVVSGHHEKWDGSGYPQGRSGDEIPLSARIFAVADVFDALCSRRPYKEPMPFERAMAILENDTGSHFDPSVMAVFRKTAADIHRTLADADDALTRKMLHQRVHHHFGI